MPTFLVLYGKWRTLESRSGALDSAVLKIRCTEHRQCLNLALDSGFSEHRMPTTTDNLQPYFLLLARGTEVVLHPPVPCSVLLRLTLHFFPAGCRNLVRSSLFNSKPFSSAKNKRIHFPLLQKMKQ